VTPDRHSAQRDRARRLRLDMAAERTNGGQPAEEPGPRPAEESAGRRPAQPPLTHVAKPPFDFMGALRGAVAHGGDLPGALEGAAGAFPESVRDVVHGAARRLRGEYSQDEWGFDEEFVEIVYPLFELMYERWWRVTTTGAEHIPAHDRALLVANHAGVLPWDATMMSVAILKNHPLPRHPRFMVLDWAFRLPWASAFLRRVGGVVASPYNAIRLLDQGHLVMVFPEGSKGAGKPFSERYRLQRFGRGGFVELALRTGAPIIPVAIVGSEEIYPKLGESRLLARLSGAPYFPLTPTFPWFGLAGAVPLPSKWRIQFCAPIDLSSYGPDAAEDRSLVFELSERVRETIQSAVYENLLARGSAFL
jgi:1-acyl-sn-glycerol-3-phosphate acyltransferase